MTRKRLLFIFFLPRDIVAILSTSFGVTSDNSILCNGKRNANGVKVVVFICFATQKHHKIKLVSEDSGRLFVCKIPKHGIE